EGSDPRSGGAWGSQFYLMEMNTRLQVEHPVTEALTGLDLVEWQLRVARGEALPLTQDEVRLEGHAVEVRLCAEDARYIPQTGTVHGFHAPDASGGLRLDHAIEHGLVVSPHYDAMLGKWISHAPTREEALDRLTCALNETRVLGVQSNRAFLAACLSHPLFRAGQALVPFLQGHGDEVRERLGVAAGSDAERVAALAVLYARSLPAAALPCPWARPVRLSLDGRAVAIDVLEIGGAHVRLSGAGLECTAHVAPLSDGSNGKAVILEGQCWVTHAVATSAGRWHVQLSGGGEPSALEVWIDDVSMQPPGGVGNARVTNDLRAPFNGKLIGVKAVAGQAVIKGETLLVVESMKLEHSLAAPRDGIVAELLVEQGQQLGPGQLLMRFEAET
ncbi:biotin/lipoyl-containing protein, partial [Hydrogenophaga crassostreae]